MTMTVKELIKKLEEFDGDMPVYIEDSEGYLDYVSGEEIKQELSNGEEFIVIYPQ